MTSSSVAAELGGLDGKSDGGDESPKRAAPRHVDEFAQTTPLAQPRAVGAHKFLDRDTGSMAVS